MRLHTSALSAVLLAAATSHVTTTVGAFQPSTTAFLSSTRPRTPFTSSLQYTNNNSPSSPPSTATTNAANAANTMSLNVASVENNIEAPVVPRDPSQIPNMPVQGEDGVWNVATPDEHAALMEYASDKLTVLKVFAPWCRACKGLEPKFLQISRDAEFINGVPILFASLSIQHNKAFVQGLGVLALPTIQFYVGGKLLDTFPCGPSKVPILKRKLAAVILEHVDEHGVLKPESIEIAAEAAELAAVAVKHAAAKKEAEKLRQKQLQEKDKAVTSTTSITPKESILSESDRARLLKIPYISSMALADQDQVLDQVVQLTFQPGSILVREGKPGRTFYVIDAGEVEICQQTFHFSDPMVQQQASAAVTDSSGYLGSVVNRLGPGDWFGERALITGEPRAASLRVSEAPVTLWAFDKDVFPFSNVLSGKSQNTQQAILDQVNDKYGVDLTAVSKDYQDQVISKQLKDVSTANQVRGSVYNNEPLPSDDESVSSSTSSSSSNEVVNVDDDAVLNTDFVVQIPAVQASDDAIFSLLTRFQMIRHVSTCFKYIQETRAIWGDPGIRTRRNLLVSKLSESQRTEFTEIFQIMDMNNDGCIELAELKRLMESIGETTDELGSVLESSNGYNNAPQSSSKSTGTAKLECPTTAMMTFEDYMGIMAEAEFYHLFRDIFASLDENNSGFVKASELDRVLCGVRDLISDDRKSVIDVDDKDMLIDYEQFSRMLLGTTLI